MVRLCSLGMVLVVSISSVHADKPPPIDKALSAAKRAKKPLVAEFYTSWCTPCKEFKAEVLPLPEIQRALADVSFVQYDAEDDGVGAAAAKKYSVRGFPTFLVIDSDGKVTVRKIGALSAEKFEKMIFAARYDVLDERGIEDAVRAKPDDPRRLLAAARWYQGRLRYTKALSYYDKAAAADANGDAGVAADAVWRRNILARKKIHREQAIKDALAFARRFPGDARALEAIVVAGVGKGAPTAELEKLGAKICTKIPARHVNNAVYALIAAGATRAAVAAGRRQVREKPRDANGYDSLAEALYQNKQRRAAVRASNKALAMGKGHEFYENFKANNKRFRKRGKPVLDSATAQWRQRAVSTLGDPQSSHKLPTVNRRRRMSDFRKFYNAYVDTLRRVGKTCAPYARTLEDAYVRIELRDKGGKPKRVWVLEPDISAELRRCLLVELRKQTFPAPPAKRTESLNRRPVSVPLR